MLIHNNNLFNINKLVISLIIIFTLRFSDLFMRMECKIGVKYYISLNISYLSLFFHSVTYFNYLEIITLFFGTTTLLLIDCCIVQIVLASYFQNSSIFRVQHYICFYIRALFLFIYSLSSSFEML